MDFKPRRPLLYFCLVSLVYALVVCVVGLKSMPSEQLQPQPGTLRGRVAGFISSGVLLEGSSFSLDGESYIPAGGVVLAAEGMQYLFIGQQIEASVVLSPITNGKNPGAFNFRQYCYTLQMDYAASGQILAVHGRQSEQPFFERARQALAARIKALWPEHAGIMQALLLGQKDMIDEELMQSYNKSGVAHVLAVSGLHVGFIAAFLSLFLFFLPNNSTAKLISMGVCLLFYALLTGASPSIVRACFMLFIAMGTRLLGRKPDSLSTVFLTAGIMLFAQPKQIVSASFQLSFSAVLGILLLAPRLERLLSFLPKWLKASISITIGAQLGCLPLLAAYYGSVPLISIIANLAVVPLAGASVMLGMGTLLLSYIWPALATLPGLLVSLCVDGMNLVTGAMAAVPGGSLPMLRMPLYLHFAWLALCYVCSLYFMEKPLKARISLASLSAASFLVGLALWLPPLFPGDAQIAFLSVGAADSAIVRKGSTTLVIDTGRSGRQTANALHLWDPYVEAVFITHADSDHAGGLLNVLDFARVQTLVYPKGLEADRGFYAALQQAQGMGVRLQSVAAGDVLWYDDLAVEVLWPGQMQSGEQNEYSMVLRVVDGESSALFAADITGDTQKHLLLPSSDVLKIPHHGSRDRLSDQSLKRIAPAACVISVGPNPYGLPSEETLKSLAGYKMYRTDEDGAIIAVLGEEVTVRKYAP